MADINIYGTLKSQTGDGKLAKAAEIYDDALGKFQSEINQQGGGGGGDKANIVDVATLSVGSVLEHFSSECVFNYTLYPATSFPIVHDQSVLTIVYATSSSVGMFYVFNAKTLTAIYNDSNVPDWIKEGFAIYKQDTLVSGTNIKTVNGNSLLGSGDVSVGTYSKPSDGIPLSDLSSFVRGELQDGAEAYSAFRGGDLELTENKVTSISSTSTDVQYPSAKAVWDMIGDVESLLAAI